MTTGEGRLRPNTIVMLPCNKIGVVDAKVPREGYLNALDATNATQRITPQKDHARQVPDDISKLSCKAYDQHYAQSPECAVLFLPGEVFFSAALQ